MKIAIGVGKIDGGKFASFNVEAENEQEALEKAAELVNSRDFIICKNLHEGDNFTYRLNTRDVSNLYIYNETKSKYNKKKVKKIR